ncbi:OadG family protein [Treponema sp.]|uniref:OadG family protein n=1 Tax=Treponema sp. TaxID=166 RepID=UPI00298DF6AF|nr:OadG family protein [Treponema sp.]MCR5613984.1 OadG family protein [Treponema sp.]
MTINDMLGQSGILTLLGMGVVFTFLIILIICMYALHAVLHALKLDKDEAPAKSSSPSAASGTPAASADNGAVIAAIAAAVHDKALNS